MLVHPWDAPLDDAEWRDWLARHDFGQLVAAGRDRDVPVVVPAHFRYDGATTIELHLARPNPVWAAIGENPTVLFAVVGDYATVQLTCAATVVDDAARTAALLRRQRAHFQPEGGYADVGDAYYARLLPQIRGLRLEIREARGKFTYGGNKSAEHRSVIAQRLAGRNGPMDDVARAHLLRRSAQ